MIITLDSGGQSDRPTALCMEGPRQRRALAQMARPGGLGKKKGEAALVGDTWGEEGAKATPPWQAWGGGSTPTQACTLTTHHQQTPTAAREGLGTQEGQGRRAGSQSDTRGRAS